MKSDYPSLTRILFALLFIIFCCLQASSQTNVPGTAVSLNGTTNAWLNVPNGTWFSGNFTVEAWVKVNSINSWSRLIDFSDGPNTNNVYVALSDSTTGDPAMGVFTNNDSSPFFSPNTQLPLNQWVHLAATGNSTNGTIFLNGTPVGTGMLNIAPNIVRTDNYIGRSVFPTDAYANAIFDELSIWNVARTRVQIQTGMNHPLSGYEPGLAGYWRFDEGNGTNAFDSTGNGNTATLNSGVTWTNSSAPLTNAQDYALSFNGSQAVTIPHQAAHDSYPFTVMCWFMEPTNSPGNGALVGNYVSSSFNGWQLASSGGQLYAWYYRDSSDHVGNTGAGAVTDGRWHHAAFVVNSSGGVIYLDGVPKQTNVWAGTAGPCTTTEAAFLGIYQGDSLFTGDIDEVSLWNAALTPSQIQNYMHQPLQGTESGLISYYRMNEGIGTNIYDYTTNAITGTFSAGPSPWIISGAQLQEPPQLVTLPATTNGSSATLSGTINPQGLNSGSWFRWGTNTSYGNITATNTFAASYTISTNTITLIGLSPGTWHFQIVATNSTGTNYGIDQSFTIVVPPVPPQVATLPAATSGNSATLNGTVNPEGQNTRSWFNWGLTTSYGNVTATNNYTGSNIIFTNSVTLTGLAPGTYHFQIAAANASGTNYGVDQSFAITAPPQVTTEPATLNGVSPTLNGTVNPEGLATGSWFNWGLTTSYGNVTAANTFAASYSPSASASTLGSLSAGTYHFQIVATNAMGTNYGSDQSFTITTQFQLGNTNVLEGPASGEDSVVMGASPFNASWSATANASWLHLVTSSGVGSANVIFSFDTNSGATRTGTLTIAGQTVTVTQAGSTYVQAGALTTLTGFSQAGPANGITVDSAGDVYYVDDFNNLWEWFPASDTISNVIRSYNPNFDPIDVAVDGAGNLFIANAYPQGLFRLTPANGNFTELLSLSQPVSVALDSSGNAYVTDQEQYGITRVAEWVAANGSEVDVADLYGGFFFGVAVDAANNVYYSDTWDQTINERIAQSGSNITLTNEIYGPFSPDGLAVDGGGNLYIANGPSAGGSAYTITRWSAITHTQTTVVPPAAAYNSQYLAVDSARNLYIANGAQGGTIQELPYAFVDPTPKSEPVTAGSDSLPLVLPANINLNTPFAPTSDQSWLTITGTANGVVSFSFTANNGPPRAANIQLLGQTIAITQAGAGTLQLGITNLVEGPIGGTDSVIVVVNPATLSWTASPNASWLHLSATNQSGNTDLLFTFDTNTNATRTGTLTIGNQTLTVTQAGSNYVVATQFPITLDMNGVQTADGMAMDSAGNIYWAVDGPAEVQEWIATNDTVITLISSGLEDPVSVAVDSADNVYVVDQVGRIMKWTAVDGNLTTLVGSGLKDPNAVALDTTGNVYIADTYNNAIKEWLAASSNVVTLVSSGLNRPSGVAVDLAGNVYIADTDNGELKEWSPATGNVTTLATASGSVYGIQALYNLAVDGSGNVFMGQSVSGDILEWSPDGALSVAAYDISVGVAVDSSGNLFIVHNPGYPSGQSAIRELPRAFIVPVPVAKAEPFTGGNDALPPVVPPNILQAPGLYPTSNQPWVAITGVTNGVTSFSIAPNDAGVARSANIILLGNDISITQNAVELGTTNLLEGPAAGTDSITLAVSPPLIPWTASSDVGWLHPPVGYPTVAVPTNVIFTFDANPGATRTGTLTLGSMPLSVTQAGVTYVAAPATLTALVTNGLAAPTGVAVDTIDSPGYVYIADAGDQVIDEWMEGTNSIETIVSGLVDPTGVAFDNNSGLLFYSDAASGIVYYWYQGLGNELVPFITSGLNRPYGIAEYGSGNYYIADPGNNAIEESFYSRGTHLVTLVSGLNGPEGVAVDAFGDVYIADTGNNAIKEWFPANSNLVTIVSTGLNQPAGLAVDASGNIFIADTGDNAIKEWTAVNSTLITLVGTGVNQPGGVALDSADDLYIADTGNNMVEELPRAFVEPTALLESYSAGSDALPPILPASVNLLPPFAPTSDQPWLTVTNTDGGIVNFAFTANTGMLSPRTAHLNVLGVSSSVTQTNAPVVSAQLTGAQVLANGAFQFTFTNTPGTTFTVLATTNLALPLTNWMNLGTVSNISPGIYQFTSPLTNAQEFYEVTWP